MMASRAVLVVVAPGMALALQALQTKAMAVAMEMRLATLMAAVAAVQAAQASLEHQAAMAAMAWHRQSQERVSAGLAAVAAVDSRQAAPAKRAVETAAFKTAPAATQRQIPAAVAVELVQELLHATAAAAAPAS